MLAYVLHKSDIQFISDSDINHENIAVEQGKDATMRQVLQLMKHKFVEIPAPFSGHTLLCDTSFKRPKPYVPLSLR